MDQPSTRYLSIEFANCTRGIDPNVCFGLKADCPLWVESGMSAKGGKRTLILGRELQSLEQGGVAGGGADRVEKGVAS